MDDTTLKTPGPETLSWRMLLTNTAASLVRDADHLERARLTPFGAAQSRRLAEHLLDLERASRKPIVTGEHVFVLHDDGEATCEHCAIATGIDLGDPDVETWEVGSRGWTSGDCACRICGREIPIIVDALDDDAIVRIDGDPATDRRWVTWAGTNTVGYEMLAEIELALVADGAITVPRLGRWPGFRIEVVRGEKGDERK